MQSIVDGLDNRFGQVSYDNIFWNKMIKDLAFLAFRAVGWNLGTDRELGGAIPDTFKAITDFRKGSPVEFTNKMAFAVALPTVTAFYGGILNYVMTGKPPERILDYFAPKTGNKDAKGYDERLFLPTYMKDVIAYNRDPAQTIGNKESPLIPVLGQIYSLFMGKGMKDFYGGLVVDPQDPVMKQVRDLGLYVAQQYEPFSFQGFEHEKQLGESNAEAARNLIGLTPAPAYITRPEVGEKYEQRQLQMARKIKHKEDQ
jgi:hypothetical protein